MLRTKNSSVLRCSLNQISRRYESNNTKKAQAKGYYPLGNPARLWGPALQETLTNWAIPGALWMAAGVATVLYFTSWNPYTALFPPKPESPPAETAPENVEATTTERRKRPARCDSQRNSDKAAFGANYREEEVKPEQINAKKCEPEPEFVERTYVFGQTKRKVKQPQKPELEKKEAEKTAENVANIVVEPSASSLWLEVGRFIGFQTKTEENPESSSSATELRQYVFGQTKRPVKVSTVSSNLESEESVSYWTQMSRIIGLDTKTTSNTVESELPVGAEMKSQTTPIDEPTKNKKSRKPPIPPPFATSADTHSELFEFKSELRPKTPYETGENVAKSNTSDKVDSPPGYWNRSINSIRRLLVRKDDD